MSSDDLFTGFRKESFHALGRTRDVYRGGHGPTIVVLSEMPGITPSLVTFARQLIDRGVVKRAKMGVSLDREFNADAARTAGLSYNELICSVLDTALARNALL